MNDSTIAADRSEWISDYAKLQQEMEVMEHKMRSMTAALHSVIRERNKAKETSAKLRKQVKTLKIVGQSLYTAVQRKAAKK